MITVQRLNKPRVTKACKFSLLISLRHERDKGSRSRLMVVRPAEPGQNVAVTWSRFGDGTGQDGSRTVGPRKLRTTKWLLRAPGRTSRPARASRSANKRARNAYRIRTARSTRSIGRARKKVCDRVRLYTERVRRQFRYLCMVYQCRSRGGGAPGTRAPPEILYKYLYTYIN